jgi:hypothetical protein
MEPTEIITFSMLYLKLFLINHCGLNSVAFVPANESGKV